MPTIEALSAAVAALQSRLDDTEAVLRVQALKARYARLVDARFERGRPVDPRRMAELATAIAGLFTADAVWDGGPVLGRAEGRHAIAAQMGASTLTFSRHFFTNPEITVRGDEARGRWELLSPCTTAAGEARWMSGVEDDTYHREPDGAWRIRSMTLTTVFLAPAATDWGPIGGPRRTGD